jgi:ketol-acid reductoisomerase
MKLSDKLTKCGDSLTINMYDNGYMVEVSGRDDDDNWKTAKILCSTLEEVYEVIKEAATVITRE